MNDRGYTNMKYFSLFIVVALSMSLQHVILHQSRLATICISLCLIVACYQHLNPRPRGLISELDASKIKDKIKEIIRHNISNILFTVSFMIYIIITGLVWYWLLPFLLVFVISIYEIWKWKCLRMRS